MVGCWSGAVAIKRDPSRALITVRRSSGPDWNRMTQCPARTSNQPSTFASDPLQTPMFRSDPVSFCCCSDPVQFLVQVQFKPLHSQTCLIQTVWTNIQHSFPFQCFFPLFLALLAWKIRWVVAGVINIDWLIDSIQIVHIFHFVFKSHHHSPPFLWNMFIGWCPEYSFLKSICRFCIAEQ